MFSRSSSASCFGLVLLVAAGTPARADLSCHAPAVNAGLTAKSQPTQVRPSVKLGRIGANELIDRRDIVRRVRHRSDLATSSFAVRRIVRRIPDLWRRRIPADVSPHALRVEHRLVSFGRPTTVAEQQDDVSVRLPAVIRRLSPVVLCKRANYQIVEGGVVIEFPVTRLPASGRYSVQIETNIELP